MRYLNETNINTKISYNVFVVSLMATDGETCKLCGKKINNDEQQYHPYHANCLKCYKCKIILSPRSYFLSNKKQFYCFRHYDHDSPSEHDFFFRELKVFRKYSIEKSKTLTNNGKVKSSGQLQKSGLDVSCSCLNGKPNGYWSECTNRNCVLANCYLLSRDFKHFNVAQWQVTKEIEQNSLTIEHTEEELYETCYDGQRHSNFYSVDERIGPIVLSLKHETIKKVPYYRYEIILLYVFQKEKIEKLCMLYYTCMLLLIRLFEFYHHHFRNQSFFF